MKTVPFRNTQVAYEVEGRGFPVVLLHGFCADSRVWEDFRLDLLEENYRVITVDLPGFGQSGVLANPPTVQDYAQAVIQVLDEKPFEEVIIIGHSMGGYVACALAEMIPKRLRGIGLFHSQPYADTEEKRAARQKQMDFIRSCGHELYVKQLIPKLFPPDFDKTNSFDIDKQIYRAAQHEAAGVIGGLQAMVSRPDRSSVLAKAAFPVLFIVGALDEAIPTENSQSQLALPAVAKVHVLPKVAHMGMVESRKATQRMVRQFVEYCLGS
ncbi:MAG: alpha/beta hydrolase [Bacteroidota bacterium]